jgi:phytoene synthase
LTIHDIGVAEAKLLWWLNAIQEAQGGQAQHPVLRSLLAGAQSPDDLPPWPWWTTQIQALMDYLHQNRWMNQAGLDRHIEATTGHAAMGAAWMLGAREASTLKAAQLWGIATRHHHQLARLGWDARAGWVHVPVDVLQQFDVKAHQLVKPQAGQTPPGWAALLRHLQGQASQATQAARLATRQLPAAERQKLRPLAVLGAAQTAVGQAVAQAGDQVLFERVGLTPLAKTWAAQRQVWRLWWGA